MTLQRLTPWVALALIATATALPAREFRVADTQPAGYPTVQALVEMDRLMAERTGGQHRIRVFHSRQLGEEKETIEQTKVGAIDLNRTNVAPIASFVPAANVLALPFLFRSVDHLHKVLDGPVGQDILASFEASGFIGLTFYDSGARSIYNTVRPIRTLADIKGLRIRVQQSDLMVAMIKAIGAEPVELPYGQVDTGLTAKLIDGAENNWPSYVTTNHYRIARNYTLTEHTMSPEVLVMSRKAWDSLTPDEKTLFRETSKQSSMFMRQKWKALEDQSRKQAQDAGNVIVADFDRAPFEAAVKGTYDPVLADPDMRRLVERIRQVR